MDICVRCGVETEWDYSKGLAPLCVKCWDAEAEVITEAVFNKREYNRAWSLAHAEENKVRCREWRKVHQSEANGYHREWIKSHREELAGKQRDYYKAHRDEQIAYNIKRNRELARSKKIVEGSKVGLNI